jgi:predicted cupin superfamily sugar epimerase
LLYLGFVNENQNPHPVAESATRVGHPSAYWIEKLGLQPHPEGGYFRQTYKSELKIAGGALRGFTGTRAASTAIYFLLEGDNFSAFHRLRSDEIWHFYAGSALTVHVISPGGEYSEILLGNDTESGQVFQAIVRAGSWFASHVRDWKGWALVGCTVAPGFEFEDFEMGPRERLIREYPQHARLITRLSRE